MKRREKGLGIYQKEFHKKPDFHDFTPARHIYPAGVISILGTC